MTKYAIIDQNKEVWATGDNEGDVYNKMKTMSSNNKGKHFYLMVQKHSFYTPTDAEKADKELWQ